MLLYYLVGWLLLSGLFANFLILLKVGRLVSRLLADQLAKRFKRSLTETVPRGSAPARSEYPLPFTDEDFAEFWRAAMQHSDSSENSSEFPKPASGSAQEGRRNT